MSNYLQKKRFSEIDLSDSFFDSLKSDYFEFDSWFNRKGNEEAYTFYENSLIQGFLYIKTEIGPVKDVDPVIEGDQIIKIGTFKINPHGSRLGERFIKKALDYSITENAEKCYVTIFEKHKSLIELLERYGFKRHGIKKSGNGNELVLVKNFRDLENDILLDYPLIKTYERNKFILSIRPEFHSQMFPDSILNNENVDILEDVSYTNSIHKIYVTKMAVFNANIGDIFVMYRTKTPGQSAEYSSVVTSICMVEEIKRQNDFGNFEQFFNYANTYSIFNKEELQSLYKKGGYYTVKMTYNAALTKKLIRKKLIEELNIPRDIYWGFFQLTDDQFRQIVEEGEVHESLIID